MVCERADGAYMLTGDKILLSKTSRKILQTNHNCWIIL